MTLNILEFIGESNDEALEMDDIPVVESSSSGISSARQLVDTTSTAKLVSDSVDCAELEFRSLDAQ